MIKTQLPNEPESDFEETKPCDSKCESGISDDEQIKILRAEVEKLSRKLNDAMLFNRLLIKDRDRENITTKRRRR